MNFFTYQDPFEGASCVGILTYHIEDLTEQREWIIVPLLDTLVPGQTYYCSFEANAAFGGNAEYPQVWLASNNVGMLFTTYDRHWYWGDPYPAAFDYAHILYPQVLSDTVGWTTVSGSFVADSAYTYLMIGNFFSNALTDTLHFADPDSVFPWYPWGYTLIDAVCVTTSSEGCGFEQGVTKPSGSKAVLYPNPARDQLIVGGWNGARIVVLDAVGRVVRQGRVEGDSWELQVGGWPRGAYALRLEGKGRVEVHKFVLTE